MTNSRLLATSLLVWALSPSCDEYQSPAPESPVVVPEGQTTYQIGGSWNGMTDQGRPIAFVATTQEALGNPLYHANVVQGQISLHHDCSGGRLVLQLTGYDTEVRGNSFSGTAVWRRDEPDGKYYTGVLTVSGRFINGDNASGGFVNSVTDKYADNLGVCGPVSGTWSARRNP